MKTLRLLVPLDQTEASTKSLKTVHDLAPTADRLMVELLHSLPPGDADDPDERQRRQEEAETFLAQQAEALRAAKIEPVCRVEWGDPAAVILQRTQQQKFDFVCMTTRTAASEDGRPGSVARRLFRKCPVPIIALSAEAAPPPAVGRPDYFRSPIDMPGELQLDHVKNAFAVIVCELGAQGALLETISDKQLDVQDGLLTLTLPTRNSPLELPAKMLGGAHASENGQAFEVLFPKLNVGQEDAIVYFLNQLRVLEKQQRTVAAPVLIDVITGPRAYAVFHGRTTVVRPDYVWLHMDNFDHIEGADVSLQVASSDGAEVVTVEGTVSSVKAIDKEYDVEVELAEAVPGHQSPGEGLMAFLRQHYREESEASVSAGSATAPRAAKVLIPKPVRPKRNVQPVARVATATYSEWTPPVRTGTPNTEISFEKRGRDAERRALEAILRPRRKAPPLRSM